MRVEAGDVHVLAGVTRAQLLHWRRIGLVWPSTPADGRGRPALFDEEDIEWIRSVRELVDLGVEPGRIVGYARTDGIPMFTAKLEATAERMRRTYPAWVDSLREVLDSA